LQARGIKPFDELFYLCKHEGLRVCCYFFCYLPGLQLRCYFISNGQTVQHDIMVSNIKTKGSIERNQAVQKQRRGGNVEVFLGLDTGEEKGSLFVVINNV